MKLISSVPYFFTMVAVTYSSFWGHIYRIPLLGNLPVIGVAIFFIVAFPFVVDYQNYKKVTMSDAIRTQYPRLYTLMHSTIIPGLQGKMKGPDWINIHRGVKAGRYPELSEEEIEIVRKMNRWSWSIGFVWIGMALATFIVFALCGAAEVEPFAITYK